jgi:hypothetical protein
MGRIKWWRHNGGREIRIFNFPLLQIFPETKTECFEQPVQRCLRSTARCFPLSVASQMAFRDSR